MSIKQRVVFFVCLLLFQLLHIIASCWLLCAIVANSASRCRKIALSYDQLGNATMGNNEDETMSSMLGRTGKPAWLVTFVNWVFFRLYGQVNHCQTRIEPQFKDKGTAP